MYDNEQIERVRQAIMRWRELLDIMQQRWQVSDKQYHELFNLLSPEQRESLREKEQQWEIAEQLVEDTTQLQKELSKMRFAARDLERAFEEVHDKLVEGA